MELWLTVNGKTVSASSQLDPLTRAVVISLFTHRRADPDDNVDVPMGWWGDIGNSLSGCGGDSEFYGGSNKVGGNSNGIDAKDGAGGSGASSVSNPSGGFSGGLGGKGLIQFWEYA